MCFEDAFIDWNGGMFWLYPSPGYSIWLFVNLLNKRSYFWLDDCIWDPSEDPYQSISENIWLVSPVKFLFFKTSSKKHKRFVNCWKVCPPTCPVYEGRRKGREKSHKLFVSQNFSSLSGHRWAKIFFKQLTTASF